MKSIGSIKGLLMPPKSPLYSLPYIIDYYTIILYYMILYYHIYYYYPYHITLYKSRSTISRKRQEDISIERKRKKDTEATVYVMTFSFVFDVKSSRVYDIYLYINHK